MTMHMLESIYIELLNGYGVTPSSTEELWLEIKRNNLKHLEDLYEQLLIVKNKIENWNVILFTLYYHDIIYKATRKDNEEKSGELASIRMTKIGVSKNDINRCYQQITATKTHNENLISDSNYFNDADLSILGRESFSYKEYCRNIRKEYSVYPDLLYTRGRKKVVNHFLSMKSIYKTDEFYSLYEKTARQNLKKELLTNN